MAIDKIVVCGAGTMGSGIAQVAAAGGFAAVLFDVNETVLQKAKANMAADLEKLVTKEKISAEQKTGMLQRILFTSNIQQCTGGLVIEAIVEKPEIKVALFNQLAAINTAETIFATNTSSLSVTRIAAQIVHPERVAGLHFFNPAPVMKLVEVVQAQQTAASVIDMLMALTKQLGKTPVLCKDAPGFIVNRVARPYYIESLRLAEEGIADYATIDRLLENIGFKMGAFKLMDLIGNDINYAVSCSVYNQLQQPERLQPSYLQKQKVDTGALGKKTGNGYYQY